MEGSTKRQCGENRCLRKTVPAKNGAEKDYRRNLRRQVHADKIAVGFDLGESDSVKRHLRGRHLSVLNLKFDFISDGGCTREKQIALSLKRHLFLHGGREPKAFWICFSRVHPPSEIKSNFKFKNTKAAFAKAAFDTL